MLTSINEIYELDIPCEILPYVEGKPHRITIKPLSLYTFQLIAKATKNDHSMIPVLIIKESLLEPSLSITEIQELKVGLANYIISKVKEYSGII